LTILRLAIAATALATLSTGSAADEIGCVDTAWALFGNHKVCVSGFDDPAVPGVTCHLSHAKTGGLLSGLATSPSEFSIACRQTGPIKIDPSTLPAKEDVFAKSTSIFFKKTHVVRLVDAKRRTLVYIAISDKLIDGSPKNSISTVPIQPWQ
jgi:CreA protein